MIVTRLENKKLAIFAIIFIYWSIKRFLRGGCMKETITAGNLPVLNIDLAPNETMIATAGEMILKTKNVRMDTEAKGGILSSLGRAVAGESFFMVKFTPTEGTGRVAFAGDIPGKFKRLDISQKPMIIQRGGYVCSSPTVNIEITLTKKIGAGFFGGEGFILQKLSGSGIAYVYACGDLLEFDLKAGQELQVQPGNIVAFEESITYDIATVGGIKTMFLGGEGFFLATLKGPGKVYLQSTSLARLVMAILPMIPSRH